MVLRSRSLERTYAPTGSKGSRYRARQQIRPPPHPSFLDSGPEVLGLVSDFGLCHTVEEGDGLSGPSSGDFARLHGQLAPPRHSEHHAVSMKIAPQRFGPLPTMQKDPRAPGRERTSTSVRL